MKGMKGKLLKKMKSMKPVGYLKLENRVLQVSASNGYVLKSCENILVDQNENKLVREEKTDPKKKVNNSSVAEQGSEVIDVAELMRDLEDEEEEEKENIAPVTLKKISDCSNQKAEILGRVERISEIENRRTPGFSEMDVSSFRKPDLNAYSLFDPNLLAAFHRAVAEHFRLSEEERQNRIDQANSQNREEGEEKTEDEPPSKAPRIDQKEKEEDEEANLHNHIQETGKEEEVEDELLLKALRIELKKQEENDGEANWKNRKEETEKEEEEEENSPSKSPRVELKEKVEEEEEETNWQNRKEKTEKEEEEYPPLKSPRIELKEKEEEEEEEDNQETNWRNRKEETEKEEEEENPPSKSPQIEEDEGKADPLLEFEEKCPPGGSDSVILYTTTLRGIRKTFEGCGSVRFLLESFRVLYFERDVSMHAEFLEELRRALGAHAVPPKLFVRGRCIGGTEEVLGLHEQGKLRPLFMDVPVDRSSGPCEGCGGVRFVVCFNCNGSHKVVGDDWERHICQTCNENGLILCPYCC